MLGEDLVESMPVGHVAEHRDRLDPQRVGQLGGDRVETVLIALEEHQPARPQSRKLPTQLGTDRPAGSGHQHVPAGDQCLDPAVVQTDGSSRQQILDLQTADLADAHAPTDQRLQTRQRLDLHLEWLKRLQAVPDRGGARGRYGDQHLVRPSPLNDLGQSGPATQDLKPVNTPAPLAWVVVDEPDRLTLVGRILAHLPSDHLGGIPRTVDEHTPSSSAPTELAIQPPRQSAPPP